MFNLRTGIGTMRSTRPVPNLQRSLLYFFAVSALGLCLTPTSAKSQAAIAVGDVTIDPPTISALGFSVPITAGDDDYDAVATVAYRETGASNWITALPLMRVRPDWISLEQPPGDLGLPLPNEQFAGSIFGLTADTNYEVQINVTDPDGGDRSQIVETRTRAVPRAEPTSPRSVTVTNATELQAALTMATAGDVINLAGGNYVGTFGIDGRAGTPDNPIVVRGPVSGTPAIIDGSGQRNAIVVERSDYVHLEHLTIIGVTGESNYAIYLGQGTGLVVRRVTIECDNGIHAADERAGLNRGFYICDNDLRGSIEWPEGLATGNNAGLKGLIGIGVRGQGHTICHNTLNGFGSTLFIEMRRGSTHNIAIDFHNNDIRVSADDGIELDGAFRNVRAWNNRIVNAKMGISFQPVWGGPIYAIRNIIYNTSSAPFKLNNDPSGIVLYHNTAYRYRENDINGPYDGNAWPQLGEPANFAANVNIKNNIFVGNDDALFLRQDMPLLELDYNGYFPDGSFAIQNNGNLETYADLAAFRAGTRYETNGMVLTDTAFATVPPASVDYMIVAPPLDFALDAQSRAVDSGIVLNNINDGFNGLAPDLGVAEQGKPSPTYGVRVDRPPSAAPPPGFTVN